MPISVARAAVDLQAGKPVDAAALDAIGGAGTSASLLAPSLFRGDATYSIPIAVPPGPGGFAPKIALAYSSSAGNGPLGVGWSLDIGPQVIERSTRNGAPEYDDAIDSFELGGQRLVKTGTSAGIETFVPERWDGSRIERSVAQNYWVWLQANGTRLYFGLGECQRCCRMKVHAAGRS